MVVSHSAIVDAAATRSPRSSSRSRANARIVSNIRKRTPSARKSAAIMLLCTSDSRWAVVDVAIVGDEDGPPLIARAWAEELAQLTDADDAVGHLVRGSVEILARVAPIYEVLCRAATDPDVGRLFASVRANRRSDQQALVHTFAAAGHLRRGLDVDEAADIVYALVNEEVYLMLVGDCGWSLDRLRTWLTETLRQQLR